MESPLAEGPKQLMLRNLYKAKLEYGFLSGYLHISSIGFLDAMHINSVGKYQAKLTFQLITPKNFYYS